MTKAIQGCYEVYLFPAYEDGNLKDFMELPGSEKETEDLENPFKVLGYTVVR